MGWKAGGFGDTVMAGYRVLEGGSWVAASPSSKVILFVSGFQFFFTTVGSRSLGDTHDC